MSVRGCDRVRLLHDFSRQAMITAAPDGHKKLIIFADSRTGTPPSRPAGMQDHGRRIRLRHMMYQVIADGAGPQAVAAVTHALVERFRKDRPLIETLLPELTTDEWPFGFGPTNWEPLIRTLRYMVLREFTTSFRRLDCLESMGLAKVVYDGLSPADKQLRAWAELMGLSPEEAIEAVSLIPGRLAEPDAVCPRRPHLLGKHTPSGRPVHPGGPAAAPRLPARRLAADGGPERPVRPRPPGPAGGFSCASPPAQVDPDARRPRRGCRGHGPVGVPDRREKPADEGHAAVAEGNALGVRRLAGQF